MSEDENNTSCSVISRFGFNEAAINDLLSFHRSINSLPSFAYPWAEAELQLRAQGREKIHLVGYGSLMHPVSAARSIASTPPEGHPAVVAIGARRVFNYRMPDSVFLRYGISPGEKDRAALNAEPLDGGVLNGRLIELNVEDLPNLRTREKAYDLRPVSCLAWSDRQCSPFAAYVLCCQVEYFEGQRFMDNGLMPYSPYAKMCREGAQMVSEDFLKLYLETTYLADRKTTAREWEEDRGD